MNTPELFIETNVEELQRSVEAGEDQYRQNEDRRRVASMIAITSY